MANQLLPEHTFGYDHNDSSVIWDLKDVWEHAEIYPVVELPIKLFTTFMKAIQTTYDEDDWERVKRADLKYPILVGKTTGKYRDPYLVIDGWHRIEKHRSLGHSKIPVRVIEEMPLPFSVKGKPFEIDGLNFQWKAKRNSPNESWMDW